MQPDVFRFFPLGCSVLLPFAARINGFDKISSGMGASLKISLLHGAWGPQVLYVYRHALCRLILVVAGLLGKGGGEGGRGEGKGRGEGERKNMCAGKFYVKLTQARVF